MIHDIRDGRSTVGKLMTDEQLYAELNKFVRIGIRADRGASNGAKGTMDEAAEHRRCQRTRASLKNIETVTRQISAGRRQPGQVAEGRHAVEVVDLCHGNLDALVAGSITAKGTAGKLITDPALFNKLNDVTDRLNTRL